jgi:signal transduction histidine kinase
VSREVLKKVQQFDDYDSSQSQVFLEKTLKFGLFESSEKELNALFEEQKSAIIIIDDEYKIRYKNSAFGQLGIDEALVNSPHGRATDFLRVLIDADALLNFYEHLMMRKKLVIDSGFLLSRIDKVFLSPISTGGFLIKIIINELYSGSAANLFRYFPDLPFAYCGFRIGNLKRTKIDFFSDNFQHMFPAISADSSCTFDKLVYIEDLPKVLKQISQLKKSTKGSFVIDVRLNTVHSDEPKWFRISLSRYKDFSQEQLCIAYLQDVNEEIKRQRNQESLEYDIIDGERERVAMELHDGLGQQLVAINLYLDMLKSKSEKPEEFETCSAIVADSILQMKALCYNLVPPEFNRGLLYSVDRLFGRLNEFSKSIEFRFKAKKIPIRDLENQEAYNIFRIIQEFVSNSQKYSECSLIECEIGRRNDKIAILITDNGKGFEKNNVEKGFGLKNIEKRARLANAKIEFDSVPGEGTYLFLEV